MNSVVVHYKELALKGRNRPWFIQLLVRNLRWALAEFDIASVRSVMGRIEIELGRDVPSSDISEHVRRVFGIANFSRADRSSLDFQELASSILNDLGDRSPASFRVSVRRADKRFPLTSPQIEREVGGLIAGQRLAGRSGTSGLDVHVEMLDAPSTFGRNFPAGVCQRGPRTAGMPPLGIDRRCG
jgi:thiamine biosynthesis protein ThiI